MKLQRILLFITVLASQYLDAQNAVQLAADQFARSPEFANASVSFLAVDLGTGTKIASINPGLSIPTASTAKLFSTATALEVLGPDYRPETRIYVEGTIQSDGTLNGNVWIRGGGDFTLGSRYFHAEGQEKDFLKSWVDTLLKLGIKSVSGAVIADGSEFGYGGVPDGWSWVDMGNYYGAGPSGISIFDNCLRYRFKTGAPGTPAVLKNTFPEVQGLTFHNYILSSTVSDDNSYIFGGPFSLDRFGEGALPANRASFEVRGSLPDPEFQLAYELVDALRKAGISVHEGPRSVRRDDLQKKDRYTSSVMQLVYTHKGQRIQEIVNLTNFKSINLYAEGLVCLIGYKISGNGSTEEGIRQIEKYWTGKMALSGLYLKDGSGLSRSNAISASHFCELLTNMSISKQYTSFFNSLPVAGRSGTVASLCRDEPGEGRINAKSGTINRIKSYAGYINSKSGKRIAFAITVNNYNCSSNQVTIKMEKILNLLAVY